VLQGDRLVKCEVLQGDHFVKCEVLQGDHFVKCEVGRRARSVAHTPMFIKMQLVFIICVC
jgi:hypothetical protein